MTWPCWSWYNQAGRDTSDIKRSSHEILRKYKTSYNSTLTSLTLDHFLKVFHICKTFPSIWIMFWLGRLWVRINHHLTLFGKTTFRSIKLYIYFNKNQLKNDDLSTICMAVTFNQAVWPICLPGPVDRFLIKEVSKQTI